MCGLAGSIAPEGVDASALPGMADAIRHRGPDGRGYLLWRPGAELRMLRELDGAGVERPVVGLAHLRLSIIDLRETNDQPLCSADGRLALSFNGEIYNYLELRGELEGLGHSFRTEGDTEVLLAAYAEWGPACVERMVGMWAFALLDAERRTLLLSRDRFGIKPMYWTLAGGALHFASEIKALLRAPGVEPEPEEAVVRRYLLTGGVDESERTFFEGVHALPAAHNAVIPLGGPVAEPRPERFWSLPEEGYAGGRDQAAEEFAERLAESVRLHVRSDVPVGTCLSGGLDSSAIVCVADRLRRKGEIPHYSHHGFGYVPDDAAWSERRYMEAVVDRTGLEMTYVEVGSQRFAESLVPIARQQDEPFGSTSIAAQYFVFEAARAGGMKVMLDGQGADEILGGYHHYFPSIAVALLRRRRYLAYLRFSRAQRQAFGRAPISRRHALATLAPRRASDAAAARLVEPPASPLLSEGMRERTSYDDFRHPEHDSVHDLLASSVTSFGLPALLRFEDRNSMAHSIEARVPFLDHRLVELCFRLPFDFKVDGASTKDVLRRAMRGVLPDEVLGRQDKIGFRADPAAAWSLAERHREALMESRTPYEREWLDPEGIAGLLDGSDRSTESEFALWRAINLKLWLRSFWGDGSDPLSG
jgi:asparagine synthase (glutamine-hydrolysing)